MSWIKSESEIQRNPKFGRAARALGITKAALIGHLHMLWWWAVDYAQDGVISAYDNEDIAEAIEWKGDIAKFINALINCGGDGHFGLLERTEDGDLIIHSWEDHCAKKYEKRKKEADRIRVYREKKKQKENAKGSSQADSQEDELQCTDDVQPQQDRTQDVHVRSCNVDVTLENREREREKEKEIKKQPTNEKKESFVMEGIGGVGGRGENVPDRDAATQKPQMGDTPNLEPTDAPPAEAKELSLVPETKPGFEKKSKETPMPKSKGKSSSEIKMTPMPSGPYDNDAFGVITEMYYICTDYEPDPGAEVKLIQELTKEYPGVNLFQQFRKARDWLNASPKNRKKDLRRFLRNWVSNAVNRYGESNGLYREEVVFVPVPNDTPQGGGMNAPRT